MKTIEATAAFMIFCQYQGLAKKTMSNYRWALKRLESHCIDLPQVKGPLLPVIGDSLSHVSKQDVRRILLRFFKWTAKEHGVSNPMLDLDSLPRGRKTLPEVLEEYEVRQVVASAAQDPRDFAMVTLVLDTGIRVGEVAGLERKDIGDQLRVSGKTGIRQVPISENIRDLLIARGDGPLWNGRRGALTCDGVRQAFVRLMRRAGLTGSKRHGPHILRHTFATFYIRAGGNVRILQEILGHQDLKSTMIYVHLAGRDVVKDHAQFSPIKTLVLV